jgi:hypothetical protein
MGTHTIAVGNRICSSREHEAMPSFKIWAEKTQRLFAIILLKKIPLTGPIESVPEAERGTVYVR